MMDAKQSIGILKWIRIQCDSQLKRDIDKIIPYIESLAAKAELGEIAEKSCKEAWSGMGCGNPNSECEGSCDLYTVCCSLRAKE